MVKKLKSKFILTNYQLELLKELLKQKNMPMKDYIEEYNQYQLTIHYGHHDGVKKVARYS